jgi:hypothetical protein
MSRKLFLVILNGVRYYDDYFEAKYDCTGKIGFSSYQKCSVAIRQLAYGVPGDLIDDYMRMSESMMTHKYRGSEQSSREVKPKFIDWTEGEPKNIYKS